MKSLPGSTASIMSTIHLDAVRGAAALAVLAYHIRYKFFLDYSEVSSTAFTKLFYIATSFGHDAVMVFFVLSGYLISGTILKDLTARRWSWSHYLINRLTRLYVVLLPGLILTVVWDRLGLQLFPFHPAYTGVAQLWKHDFFNVRASLTPSIFFANTAFMQSISGVPPLGSNSPLWSLTNEFAYYLIFPVALLTIWSTTGWRARLACALMTVLLVYYFGNRILLYFPIWLLGLAVRLLPRPSLPGRRAGLVRLRNVAVLVMVVGLTAGRHTSIFQHVAGAGSLEIGDYVVGITFAIGLYVLLLDRRPSREGLYVRLARGSSNISYTLYVVHMPFLIFLRAVLNNGRSWSPGLGTSIASALLFVAALAYASVAWYFFEARTSTIRDLVAHRFTAFRSLVSSGV
jgi:peptidoglycan/LPS O-acetylase OafA/YrhL